MDEERKGRIGKMIRLVASEGWAEGALEIDADWHERAVQLVRLVVADQGAGPEAHQLARAMLDDLESVEGRGERSFQDPGAGERHPHVKRPQAP